MIILDCAERFGWTPDQVEQLDSDAYDNLIYAAEERTKIRKAKAQEAERAQKQQLQREQLHRRLQR